MLHPPSHKLGLLHTSTHHGHQFVRECVDLRGEGREEREEREKRGRRERKRERKREREEQCDLFFVIEVRGSSSGGFPILLNVVVPKGEN